MNSPTKDRRVAENIMEQLRYGIPPRNFAQDFTVGRESQLNELLNSLDSDSEERALLIKANYGTGKSHLLRVLREVALKNNFVVSLIEVDSDGGIRFNRMETILGAICRNIEVPKCDGNGIGTLFNAYKNVRESTLSNEINIVRKKISRDGKWDGSEFLDAPGIYVALRAWILEEGQQAIRDLINAWLSDPQSYKSQKKKLYEGLVMCLASKFRDIRPEWKYYSDEVFIFSSGGHRQSWDALSDLHNIAIYSGFSGLILLIDEFEDVLQNLKNKKYQEEALQNLFNFFIFDKFPGRSYFSVTPEFTEKCKRMLLNKGIYDFNFKNFDELASFQLKPIEDQDFHELAMKIRNTHGIAYNWNANEAFENQVLEDFCKQLFIVDTPNKIRDAIVSLVEKLDSELEEY